MAIRAIRWICLGSLAAAFSNLSGCAPPVPVPTSEIVGAVGDTTGSDDVNDGGNGGDDGSEWFESWETAVPGPKQDYTFFEPFQADSGPWRLDPIPIDQPLGVNGRWVEYEVLITDDDRLFIRSHTDDLRWGSQFGRIALQQDLGISGNTLGFRLTTDTMLSGILDCQFHAVSPNPQLLASSGADVEVWIAIAGAGTGILVYVHEQSVNFLTDPGMLLGAAGIFYVNGSFERNLYDDLVATYGYYPPESCMVTVVRVHAYSSLKVETQESTDFYVECACELPYLRIRPIVPR